MIQINPSQIFPVVRQLQDPNDTTTLYVQAIIRNSLTGAVLNTINLTDQGGHRFTKNVQMPGDPSNQGLVIDITTTVYTDSGYTSVSPNYGQENDTYIVQQRVSQYMLGGGSGSTDWMSRDEVEKVVLKALGTLKFPEYKSTKIDPIIEALERLEALTVRIFDKNIDFSTLEKGIKSLAKAISEVDSRFPSIEGGIGALARKETDLTPIVDRLDSVLNRVAINHNSYSTSLKSEVKSLFKDISKLVDERLLDKKKFNENKKRVKEALESIIKGEEGNEENIDMPKPPKPRDFSSIISKL